MGSPTNAPEPSIMKEKLFIVKIGGNVINDPTLLKNFLSDFYKIKGKKILIHGGGKLLDQLAASLNIPQNMINGRRVTDAESLKLASMVYAGYINKNLVSQLQLQGCNAIGLTGADGNILKAKKRNSEPIDFGFVGDCSIEDVNQSLLKDLLHSNLCPVFCSLTHDGQGQLLNTNADTITSVLAMAMKNHFDVDVIYCFEKSGLLRDKENEHSRIEKINRHEIHSMLQESLISDGMIPKIQNIAALLDAGISTVRLVHAAEILAVIQNSKNIGTLFYAA